VATVNALQLEAADAAPVVLHYNRNTWAKFEVGQPVRCCLTAFFTVDTLCYDMTLIIDLEHL